MEPASKRFKPSVTIDLTQSDSDSDDDDIQITGVNVIKKTPTPQNHQTNNSPTATQQQKGTVIPIPPLPAPLPNEGLVFNTSNGMLLDGVLFKTHDDIERREFALQSELERLNTQVSNFEAEKDPLDLEISKLLVKKRQIELLGFTSKSNTQIRTINQQVNDLSTTIRRKDASIEQFKALVMKTQQKLLKFKNTDKNTISTLLDVGDFTERSEYLQLLRNQYQPQPAAELQLLRQRLLLIQNRAAQRAIARNTKRAQQANNTHNVFQGMTPNGSNDLNRLHMNPYMRDLDDDTRDELTRGLNIYSSNDAQDLRALLESVKKIEQSKDDESNTPDELTINLLRHQKQGLKWLEEIEDDPKKRGGILADDMGLGKTVQAISLMLSHRPNSKTNKVKEKASGKADATGETEDENKDKSGNDSVLIGGDNNDDITEEEEREDEKDADYQSDDEDVIDEGLTPETREVEDCEEDGKTVCKTNLIVCPVALMEQWKSEIETKVKESARFRVMIYNSLKGKKVTFKQLSRYDVVLVSYQTLSSELKKHCKADGKITDVPNIARINRRKLSTGNRSEYFSPFYEPEADFRRIILDEAQMIKNRLTSASVSCAALTAKYRWCLSGTPIQNNIDELFPLIRFLQIKPYCNYGKFAVDISRPMKGKFENYDEHDKERAFNKIRVLLKAFLLRREKTSKIDGKPILELPEKTIIKHNVNMQDNKNEQSFYSSLEQNSAREVEKLLNGPKAKGSYSSILTLLLRLRQACIHSELVRIGERKQGIVYDDDGQAKHVRTIDSMFGYAKGLKKEVVTRINNAEANEENRFLCPICLDVPADEQWMLASPCGHGMCDECVDKFFEQFQEGQHSPGFRKAKCTTCRMEIKEDKLFTYDIFDRVVNKGQNLETIKIIYEQKKKAFQELKNQPFEKLELSPKFKKALELIRDILAKSTDEKVIVFSEFTAMFSIFQKFLKREGISSLLYVGSMNSDARNETVKTFYRDPAERVLLISLKAGNVGLTLTCANHVILMDPFWNPYVEDQAQDRAYRIGQNRPVKIHRLLNASTVEDRIIELQEKKKAIIESAMGSEGLKKASALGTREIGFLFGLNDLDRGG